MLECAHNYMFVTRSCYCWFGSAWARSIICCSTTVLYFLTKCDVHKKKERTIFFLMRKKKKASIWIDFFLFFFFSFLLLLCIKYCLLYRGIEHCVTTAIFIFCRWSFMFVVRCFFLCSIKKGKEFCLWLRTIIQSLSFAYCQFLGMYSRWFDRGINTLEYYKELIQKTA